MKWYFILWYAESKWAATIKLSPPSPPHNVPSTFLGNMLAAAQIPDLTSPSLPDCWPPTPTILQLLPPYPPFFPPSLSLITTKIHFLNRESGGWEQWGMYHWDCQWRSTQSPAPFSLTTEGAADGCLNRQEMLTLEADKQTGSLGWCVYIPIYKECKLRRLGGRKAGKRNQ